MLRHPHILGDPQQRGVKQELVTDKGEQNENLTHAFSGAQLRTEMLCHP